MANSLSMWDIMVFLLWGIDAIVAMTITATIYPYAIFFTLCLLQIFCGSHPVQRVRIVVLVTMLFGVILWLVQYDNVHVRSITGFVVTAAPSALLSVAAWFLKRKFLTDISESQTDDQKTSSASTEEFSLRTWKGWSLKVYKTLHCLGLCVCVYFLLHNS